VLSQFTYAHVLLSSDTALKITRQVKYKGADKTLARPVRKQATVTDDFDFCISYL
jgi:hypothetical protein